MWRWVSKGEWFLKRSSTAWPQHRCCETHRTPCFWTILYVYCILVLLWRLGWVSIQFYILLNSRMKSVFPLYLVGTLPFINSEFKCQLFSIHHTIARKFIIISSWVMFFSHFHRQHLLLPANRTECWNCQDKSIIFFYPKRSIQFGERYSI